MGFIKENIFIVLGITLPLALVAFLSLSQHLSQINVEPPQYKIAYLLGDTRDYRNDLRIKIAPDTKTLKLSLKKNKNKPSNADVTLHIYDASKDDLQSYPIDIESIYKENKTINIPLPDTFKHIKFRNKETALDGYKFERAGYRNGSVLTEIFGYSRHNRKDFIVKDGNRIELPSTMPWPHTKFIGWVEQ